MQCIREAEKDLVMNEFSDKIGQIVTGTVQNIEGNTYLINLEKLKHSYHQKNKFWRDVQCKRSHSCFHY